MAGEWRMRRLGELTDNFDGRRIPVKEADRRQGPYPYYGASGIVDYVDDYLFDGEYLLIAEDGENLRTRNTPVAFLARGKFWVNNHAHIVRANDQSDTRYLMYALQVADISAYLTGSTMPKLTQGNMNRILVPAPPIDEQRAIAHILGTLDDKIELNRRMSETLEAMARALFKSWFVDFDPVRAKMEGRQPKGMDAETAALFPDAFGPDGLPRGWEDKGLDEVASFLNGLALQKFPPDGDDDLPVIKIAQLRKGDTTGADLANNKLDSQYVVNDGDILFSWSGSLEAVVWTGGRGALNQHLFKVTSSTYPKWFFFFWILHHLPDFQDIAANKATTMGHIQRHHLSQARVNVPSSAILEATNSQMEPLLAQIIRNNIESRTLAALRDALLPKLLSGELLIDEADYIAE
jgi:type I restriction enzyme S subunit